jgi:hypothetical protein
LRVRESFLERTTDAEAIVALLRIMASTPYGSWNGGAHFGLREFFEQARMRPELPQTAIQEGNAALVDLGITDYRIDRIAKEESTDRDVDSYTVTLITPGDVRRTISFTSSGAA